MLLNNDRILLWYVSIFFGWIICFSLLGIPIFHLWLGLSIVKIAVLVGICCGVQLALVPWFYSARSTPQNPDGLIGRRTAVVFVWLSLTTLLVFYSLQRGWPSNPTRQNAHIIMFASLVVALIIVGVLLRFNMRSIAQIIRILRGKGSVPRGPGDSHLGA